MSSNKQVWHGPEASGSPEHAVDNKLRLERQDLVKNMHDLKALPKAMLKMTCPKLNYTTFAI